MTHQRVSFRGKQALCLVWCSFHAACEDRHSQTDDSVFLRKRLFLCWLSFPQQKGLKIKMFRSVHNKVHSAEGVQSRRFTLSSAWKRERSWRISSHWLNNDAFQSWKKEPVKSAATDMAAMMSQCLITSQPEDLGFLQLTDDIIGNWFWRWLQALLYETWNCWTKPPEQEYKRLWQCTRVHYW